MKLVLLHLSVLVSGVCCVSHLGVSNHTFPTDFLIGASTAAYQIEGAWNESGKGVSIWDTYVHERNFTANGDTGDVAADSYHLFEQDVLALKQLGVDVYRFSISWPRILPTGYANVVNPKGVDHYNFLIDELRRNDIVPMVTMYHWDLPQPLQDLGGWANPLMADFFEDYADILFREYGDRVKWWITINEPASITEGYDNEHAYAPGVNATGVGYYLAAHTLIKAHARAYRLYDRKYRNEQKGKVSLSLPSYWYEPKTNTRADVETTEGAMQYTLGLFANPIFSCDGDYPKIVKEHMRNVSLAQGYHRSRLPQFTAEEILDIKGTYDFLGLNYYTSRLVSASRPTSDVFSESDYATITVDPNWPTAAGDFIKVVPWGFRKLLNWVKKEYNNVPVFVTENGYADTGEIHDLQRITYIVSHMSEMVKAIHEDDCKVIGYTVWSLIDNMEWTHGYTQKFGLFYVNFSDPKLPRVPKSSAYVFSEITRQRQLPRYYLEITGELPATDVTIENTTEHHAQGNHSDIKLHANTNNAETFLKFRGTFLFVLSATVICFINILF